MDKYEVYKGLIAKIDGHIDEALKLSIAKSDGDDWEEMETHFMEACEGLYNAIDMAVELCPTGVELLVEMRQKLVNLRIEIYRLAKQITEPDKHKEHAPDPLCGYEISQGITAEKSGSLCSECPYYDRCGSEYAKAVRLGREGT